MIILKSAAIGAICLLLASTALKAEERLCGFHRITQENVRAGLSVRQDEDGSDQEHVLYMMAKNASGTVRINVTYFGNTLGELTPENFGVSVDSMGREDEVGVRETLEWQFDEGETNTYGQWHYPRPGQKQTFRIAQITNMKSKSMTWGEHWFEQLEQGPQISFTQVDQKERKVEHVAIKYPDAKEIQSLYDTALPKAFATLKPCVFNVDPQARH